MKEKYDRIGTSLYKVVQRPLSSGDSVEEKILWSYETLRQDYGIICRRLKNTMVSVLFPTM
jgi:hypothetical protein